MGEMLLNGRLYGASGIRELTQAQYDALPASKLTDGILYCIKDTGIVEGEKFAPIIYSLEEREVGVWTDGKPLYQKSFYIASLPSSASRVDYTTNLNTSDISIKHSFGDVYWQNGTTRLLGVYARTSSAFDDSVQITYSMEVINGVYAIRISVGYDRSALSAMVTIQYTKTTDVPGSGKWAQDGIPAVHYSTDEKVIGTWVDGKPVYRRTFIFNTSVSVGSSWVATSAQIHDVSKILHCYGGNKWANDNVKNNSACYNIMADMNSNDYVELCIPGWSAGVKYFVIEYTKTTDY